MKICCLSDLHGHLPNIPECDLLLLAGDYPPITDRRSPFFFYQQDFNGWLKKTSQKCDIIGVAGNHDNYFEDDPSRAYGLSWTYLQDEGVDYNGLKIWGSPWTLRFYDWAFNASEEEMKSKLDLVPDDTDIILTHGPPFGFGDRNNKDEKTGSHALLDCINRVKPKLVVYGHIHEGYGGYNIGSTYAMNVAYVDSVYQPSNEIQVIEI